MLFKRVVKAAQLALGVIALASVVACNNKSSSPQNETTPQAMSPLSVSLTDAEGDFLQYEVEVKSIQLIKQNGATVNVLPRSSTVDFAQYVDVSEFLTALEVPSGRYLSLSMTLDFSKASILVQDENGITITATPIGVDQEELTLTDLDIRFSDRNGFSMVPGVPLHIMLDFDLDASNTIEFHPGGANVIVNPVVVADTHITSPKPTRLRGLSKAVHIESDQIDLTLRPFRIRDADMGGITVTVTDATQFEINGEFSDKDTALAELAELGTGTPLVIMGQWDASKKQTIATELLAGSSVPWGQADVLRGTVIARQGLNLTLRGASAELNDGQFAYHKEIQVALAETTTVRRFGEGLSDITQISVGSSVLVSGQFEQNTLDAAQGFVRIYPTSLSGTVIDNNSLSVDLNLLNGHRPNVFDTRGTGTLIDANVNQYQIDTGLLDMSAIETGDPLRIRGWVQDYGSAPEDFIATSLTNHRTIRAHLVLSYAAQAGNQAIVGITQTQLRLDTEATGGRHHIVRAGILTDIQSNSHIVFEPQSNRGLFTVTIGNQLNVYTYFDEFTEALQGYIDAGVNIARIDARGQFDQADQLLKGNQLRVLTQP